MPGSSAFHTTATRPARDQSGADGIARVDGHHGQGGTLKSFWRNHRGVHCIFTKPKSPLGCQVVCVTINLLQNDRCRKPGLNGDTVVCRNVSETPCWVRYLKPCQGIPLLAYFAPGFAPGVDQFQHQPVWRILLLELDHLGDFFVGLRAMQSMLVGFPRHTNHACLRKPERRLGSTNRLVR
jgi:hypothetical protein